MAFVEAVYFNAVLKYVDKNMSWILKRIRGVEIKQGAKLFWTLTMFYCLSHPRWEISTSPNCALHEGILTTETTAEYRPTCTTFDQIYISITTHRRKFYVLEVGVHIKLAQDLRNPDQGIFLMRWVFKVTYPTIFALNINLAPPWLHAQPSVSSVTKPNQHAGNVCGCQHSSQPQLLQRAWHKPNCHE